MSLAGRLWNWHKDRLKAPVLRKKEYNLGTKAHQAMNLGVGGFGTEISICLVNASCGAGAWVHQSNQSKHSASWLCDGISNCQFVSQSPVWDLAESRHVQSQL